MVKIPVIDNTNHGNNECRETRHSTKSSDFHNDAPLKKCRICSTYLQKHPFEPESTHITEPKNL